MKPLKGMLKNRVFIFDFWVFAGIWMLIIAVMLIINLLWCSYYGSCLIDDSRHKHGDKIIHVTGDAK